MEIGLAVIFIIVLLFFIYRLGIGISHIIRPVSPPSKTIGEINWEIREHLKEGKSK